MTETDATNKPLEMPNTFLPYLEKHRLYKLFKDMVQDLIVALPKDHLKHMKKYLSRRLQSNKDVDRVILLVSPDINIDTKRVALDMIRDLGLFVITRQCVMDRYEKHDDYVPGCVSPVLMSAVTKIMTMKEPVPEAGWLMFDHPCTVGEAHCMQQDGILPTVTLAVQPVPPVAPPAPNPHTPARSFFEQDFEGLKIAYKATLKEVFIDVGDDSETIATKCFNAIRAAAAGAQGPGQGLHAIGAPGVYRVLLIGPRGSGKKTQAWMAAKQFGLVYLTFENLLREARERMDETGEKLRKFGISVQVRAEIIRRRIVQKDCIDHGWILTGYPETGLDFEYLDKMSTPPNRVIIMNVPWETCKVRVRARGVDWCTGEEMTMGSGPRVLPLHEDESNIDAELEMYFTENLAELRAAAGITAVEIDGNMNIEQIQVKVQAAIMAAPAFDIEYCSRLRNVCGD